ncbi:O-antigen ligase family protein [Geobacillus thermodenitrificans subsp. calidus]
MQITVLGYVLIPMAFFFFITNTKMLYISTIFFIPFTASSVVNFNNGFGLQPTTLFFTLLLIKEIFLVLKNKKLRFNKSNNLYFLLIGLFLISVFISLLMPFVLSGKITIMNSETGSLTLHKFSMNNVTQTLYVLYGCLLAIYIAHKNSLSLDNLLLGIKTYLVAGVFISCWGILQWIFYYLGIPYPAFLFNNSINESAKGYLQTISPTITRVSSVAVEPSILSQSLLTVLPTFVLGLFTKQHLFSRKVNIVSIVFVTITLFLSTSSSAYIGLIFFILIFIFITVFQLKTINIKLLFGFVLFIINITFIYVCSTNFKYIAEQVLFNKSQSYSAQDRLNSVLIAKQYFADYPILGVGWGSITSHDLIFRILANSGLVGLLSFLLFNVVMFINSYKKIIEIEDGKNISLLDFINLAIFLSLLVLLFLFFLTGFPYYFSYYWFSIGCLISILNMKVSNIKNTDN